MLNRYFPDISFEGMYGFLDNQGLLASRLQRDDKDGIHLGNMGIAKYVSMMKNCVFRKVRSLQYSKAPQESAQVMDPPGEP